MKIRIIHTAVALLICLGAAAQKKELSQAEAALKSGKDLEKAEKLMTDLLKSPEMRQKKKIYLMWYRTVVAQYEAANEKLYLKQKYDTAQFFGLVERMYQVAETLDSVDARPDKKGRVRPDYRRRHAEQLDALRHNLYNGGIYQYRKGDYDRAFGFFNTYVDTDNQPLFKGYGYGTKDSMMTQAAYWATVCGYMLQKPDSVLRHAERAMLDTTKHEHVLQYMCEAYRWPKDSAYLANHSYDQDSALVATLRRGMEEFPEHPYFFPRLADWYTAHMMPDSVLAIADRSLEINPDNQLFLLAKSVAQLNLNQDNSCITTSKRLIELNDTLPEPYYNIAMVYLNKALMLEEQNEPRQNRKRLHELYTMAKPYMETYRRLAPSEQKRWAPALYRIYLYLNMGREFDKIDKLLRKME